MYVRRSFAAAAATATSPVARSQPQQRRRATCTAGACDESVLRLHGSKNLVGDGVGANGGGDGGNGEPYYVTTAINYTNGPPHCGHAYEAVVADAFARYRRLCGREVFFSTGSDEHGQKIARGAEKQGVSPQAFCDGWADLFQDLNRRLLISNDCYVRTTQGSHKRCAQALWERCAAAGDIYLADYEGWYNEREETFVPEAEAAAAGYVDAASGDPLKRVAEPCYFFRLSKYEDRLRALLSDTSNTFVHPEQTRSQLLEMLGGGGGGGGGDGGLRDLCVSRTAFEWGVPTPPGTEPGHVMYVWFDALANYLSAVGGCGEAAALCGSVKKWWPADLHVVGKDIARFHCVYWPAMLWSAGLEGPETVLTHGFVNDREGKKMSKSIGNVVCPQDVLCRVPPDTIRFYVLAEATCGSDLKFSRQALGAAHNQVLGDTLGNLAQRAMQLACKYADGAVPSAAGAAAAAAAPFDVPAVLARYRAAFDAHDPRGALQVALQACRDTNRWLTDTAPWKMPADAAAERTEAVRVALEALYAIAHLVAPAAPAAATAVFDRLATPGTTFAGLEVDGGLRVLAAGTRLVGGAWSNGGARTLFPRLEL
eukprot:Rhum_TRINITY_DN12566_c2_g1::Rhum_TRINITY_DN12566_c2_g1_i1::g.52959::m.52959/K01874/MARS, metG; methionyl-tRNA synthetase